MAQAGPASFAQSLSERQKLGGLGVMRDRGSKKRVQNSTMLRQGKGAKLNKGGGSKGSMGGGLKSRRNPSPLRMLRATCPVTREDTERFQEQVRKRAREQKR